MYKVIHMYWSCHKFRILISVRKFRTLMVFRAFSRLSGIDRVLQKF